MCHKLQQNHTPDGFSIVELSVVLTIVGMIIGFAVSSISHLMEAEKISLTRERIKAIDEAIQWHYKQYGVLPCPARTDLDFTSSGAAGSPEDCSVSLVEGTMSYGGDTNYDNWRGNVPIRALNLPTSFYSDGWNRRMEYVVHKDLAQTRPLYRTTDASITINDKNGNTITSEAAYMIISYGADEVGSTSKESSSNSVACGGSGNISDENCDSDDTYVDTDYAPSTTAANYFDDIVKWGTKYTLSMPTELPDVSLVQSGINAEETSSTESYITLDDDYTVASGDMPVSGNTTITIGDNIHTVKLTLFIERSGGDAKCSLDINGSIKTIMSSSDITGTVRAFNIVRFLNVYSGDTIKLYCKRAQAISFTLEAMGLPYNP